MCTNWLAVGVLDALVSPQLIVLLVRSCLDKCPTTHICNGIQFLCKVELEWETIRDGVRDGAEFRVGDGVGRG